MHCNLRPCDAPVLFHFNYGAHVKFEVVQPIRCRIIVFLLVIIVKQDAQLSQRDHAAGCVSLGEKWKTGTGRQYFTDIIGLSLTTVT